MYERSCEPFLRWHVVASSSCRLSGHFRCGNSYVRNCCFSSSHKFVFMLYLIHFTGYSAAGSALALGARCRAFESPYPENCCCKIIYATSCFYGIKLSKIYARYISFAVSSCSDFLLSTRLAARQAGGTCGKKTHCEIHNCTR